MQSELLLSCGQRHVLPYFVCRTCHVVKPKVEKARMGTIPIGGTVKSLGRNVQLFTSKEERTVPTAVCPWRGMHGGFSSLVPGAGGQPSPADTASVQITATVRTGCSLGGVCAGRYKALGPTPSTKLNTHSEIPLCVHWMPTVKKKKNSGCAW